MPRTIERTKKESADREKPIGIENATRVRKSKRSPRIESNSSQQEAIWTKRRKTHSMIFVKYTKDDGEKVDNSEELIAICGQ
jgi:hypothetical protein